MNSPAPFPSMVRSHDYLMSEAAGSHQMQSDRDTDAGWEESWPHSERGVGTEKAGPD